MRSLVFILFFYASASAQNVGDIAFDPRTDDSKFQLCNPDRVLQGYQLKTTMDETVNMVAKEFRAKFKTNEAWKNESGIIRIRFVVNCSGVSDRFRLLQLTFDLKEKQFHDGLTTQVLTIAKSIPWPARRAWNQTVDYYHYFSVRIVNGELSDIVQ